MTTKQTEGVGDEVPSTSERGTPKHLIRPSDVVRQVFLVEWFDGKEWWPSEAVGTFSGDGQATACARRMTENLPLTKFVSSSRAYRATRYVPEDESTERLRVENEKLRAMCEQFLKCMVPHPTEHPTMHRAWTKGQALLAELATPRAEGAADA